MIHFNAMPLPNGKTGKLVGKGMASDYAIRKRKAYMYEYKKCWLCGRNGAYDHLDVHHCFQGKNREKSDKLGLTVLLCHNRCHIFGPNAAHRNKETAQKIHEYGQRKAMEENNWTVEDFIKEFGRNYLDLED